MFSWLRQLKKPRESVSLTNGAIRLFRNGEQTFGIPLHTILKIEFYKRDALTTDLVCCDITHGNADAPKLHWLHEELDGWEEVTSAFAEQLPGFKADWREGVIRPAFEESRVVAFVRNEATSLTDKGD